MRFLVDSSVWLEVLLQQQREAEVRAFFDTIPLNQVGLTDFSLFSIALKMVRHDRLQALMEFATDIVNSSIAVVRLNPSALPGVLSVMTTERLDFDDAYQYFAAEQNNLILVSLDKHFAHTSRGYQSPREAMLESGGAP
jgi:predicted nucleic acid-binding protein